MKKRSLTSLKLNKKTITHLQAQKSAGGIRKQARDVSGTYCDSVNVCCA
ncbi:class I lanthipeptide [Kordia sp.]